MANVVFPRCPRRGIDAFVVEDGRYVSGRWPGDAYLIAHKLIERL